MNMKADDTIAELKKREEEDLARIMADRHGLAYLDLSMTTIDLDTLKLIPEADAAANSIAAVQSVGKKIQVAVTNPDRPGTKEIIDALKRKNYEVQLFLVSPASLSKAIARYKEIPRFEEILAGVMNVSQKKISGLAETQEPLADFRAALEGESSAEKGKETAKATETLELILAGALALDASDIHIEAGEKTAGIRFRIDGVLQQVGQIQKPLYQLLNSRVKLISEIKLNIHDKPQDGRFTIKTQDENIESRTSVLPGPNGESIVMRLLLPKTISITLDALGMQKPLYEMMELQLKKPNGMILTTGPTGSGKTTTLYSFLKETASSKLKTVTIEDPIEYKLADVTQTQIDPEKGYDFSNGLRSILRQDPDIILVGEIRDLETAEIAMHAALTGHLVLSTLHTNDAAGTIPRLIDLGVKTNIISPALNSVIAQRLVRVLCKECKKNITPNDEDKKNILRTIETMPAEFKTKAKAQLKNLTLWTAVGCKKCNQTGYKGRTGIFEAFLVDDFMERLIIKNPPKADIEEAARKQGMLTLYQDGILKVLEGVTSLEELNRVATED